MQGLGLEFVANLGSWGRKYRFKPLALSFRGYPAGPRFRRLRWSKMCFRARPYHGRMLAHPCRGVVTHSRLLVEQERLPGTGSSRAEPCPTVPFCWPWPSVYRPPPPPTADLTLPRSALQSSSMDMETSYLLKDITIENITSNREQDSSETSQFVATFVSTDVMISLLQRYASENNLDYDSLCFTYRDKIVTRTGSEYIDFVLDPSKNCSINHFRASMIAQAGNHHLVCLYKSNLRTLQEYPNLFTRVVDGHHPDAIRDYLMTMPTSEAVSELDELGREMDGGATPLLTLVDNSWKSEEASLLTLLEFINDLDGITDLDGNRMREQRPEIEVSEFTMPTRRPHAPGFVSTLSCDSVPNPLWLTLMIRR